MQTWKSLLIEGTVRSCVGKSSGLGGHVTCSGTKRFQEEDRKAREAARLCCNTPQQTTGPVDTAAGFFSRPESVGNSQFHSSEGSLASPTHSLKKPLPSLHLPSLAFGNTYACNFPKHCSPSAFTDTMAYGCNTWVWDEQHFSKALSRSLQGCQPRLALWARDPCVL